MRMTRDMRMVVTVMMLRIGMAARRMLASAVPMIVVVGNALSVEALMFTRIHTAPYSCALCGSTSLRRLPPARSNSMTTPTSAKPGNTASHHMPADR